MSDAVKLAHLRFLIAVARAHRERTFAKVKS